MTMVSLRMILEESFKMPETVVFRRKDKRMCQVEAEKAVLTE